MRRDKKSSTDRADRSIQQSLQHGHLSRNPSLSIQSGQSHQVQGSQRGQPRFHPQGVLPIPGQQQVA